jgi:surface antigen
MAATCGFFLGPVLGGCSIPIGTLFNKSDASDVTGSIDPVGNAMAAMEPPISGMPDADLVFARAAATDVLSKGGKDVSQAWENPATGARGAVTPLTSSYTENGNTCREFLVSHVQGKAETWLQGDACRFASGQWQVRSLKAWRRG